MPRKLRNPKSRQGAAIDVPVALYIWLLWRDVAAARAAGNIKDIYLIGPDRERVMWHAIEADAVAEWSDVYPGTRPPLWWQHSAPELRQLTGGLYERISGHNRSHPTGLPYIDGFEDDPPDVESQPSYLDRLDLWMPGERRRVARDGFASQPFSFDLTVAPHGMPPFDDGEDEHDDDA